MNATSPSPVTVETLTPAAYQGVPVITTDLLAAVYGASAKNISDNYLNHTDRFITGKHFFKVVGDELRALKNRPDFIGSVGRNANALLLWTERGAARHAKMLDTDQAWEVFEKLEDAYFRPVEAARQQDAAPEVEARPQTQTAAAIKAERLLIRDRLELIRQQRLMLEAIQNAAGPGAMVALARKYGLLDDVAALAPSDQPNRPQSDFRPGTGVLVLADQIVAFDLTDTDLRDGECGVIVRDYHLHRLPVVSSIRRVSGDRPDLDGGAHLPSLSPAITSLYGAPSNTACRVLGRVLDIRKVSR